MVPVTYPNLDATVENNRGEDLLELTVGEVEPAVAGSDAGDSSPVAGASAYHSPLANNGGA